METLRRLVRQSVHSVPIDLCHFPKQLYKQSDAQFDTAN